MGDFRRRTHGLLLFGGSWASVSSWYYLGVFSLVWSHVDESVLLILGLTLALLSQDEITVNKGLFGQLILVASPGSQRR